MKLEAGFQGETTPKTARSKSKAKRLIVTAGTMLTFLAVTLKIST